MKMSSYRPRGKGKGKGGRFTGSKGHGHGGDKLTTGTPDSESVDDSPIVKCFRVFQEELDCRNDRHERIVKLSRDITIESKRVIFLLQRVTGSENPEHILTEALDKINELNSTKFLEIAKELDGQDPYQFLRAYTSGLQEYIEAVTFYYYLSEQHLINLNKVQTPLNFTIQSPSMATTSNNAPQSATEDATTKPTGSPEDATTKPTGSPEDGNKCDSDRPAGDPLLVGCEDRVVSVYIPPSEYMLGVADFTGELMRMAINSVGLGDLETPQVVANMMRMIHNAFSVFDNTSRELRMKTKVLRQSLQKVENACYALTVRGSEVPRHMLKDVFYSAAATVDNYSLEDNDENYD